MGDVFVVEHRDLRKSYAAKLLRSSLATDERTIDRMRLEADALAKLEHENIVQIHDFNVTESGLPFIVMDLLQGQTLRDALAGRGPFEPTQALVFALQLLNGLDSVHQLGIVHRDLKPGNLFIHRTSDGRAILKLLDFGVARVVPGISDNAPSPLILPTRTGSTVGTPMFMSPEAATGRRVDHRTDLYAAANILYVMLTGRGPFDDLVTSDKILEAHVNREPPSPSRLTRTWIHPALELIVLRGLAKNPDDRFQSAADFGKAVYEVLLEYEQARRENRILTAPTPAYVALANTESPRQDIETSPRKARQASGRPLPSSRAQFAAIFAFLFLVTLAIGRFSIRWLLR